LDSGVPFALAFQAQAFAQVLAHLSGEKGRHCIQAVSIYHEIGADRRRCKQCLTIHRTPGQARPLGTRRISGGIPGKAYRKRPARHPLLSPAPASHWSAAAPVLRWRRRRRRLSFADDSRCSSGASRSRWTSPADPVRYCNSWVPRAVSGPRMSGEPRATARGVSAQGPRGASLALFSLFSSRHYVRRTWCFL
jgi:hypothetical protein